MNQWAFGLLLLLVCTIFLPSINFAYAAPDVPQPITTGQIIHATTDGETLNGGLVIQAGGELIVDSGVTLIINGALSNSGKITIHNGVDPGMLSVNGVILNSGEIIIDGVLSVNGSVINLSSGEINITLCGDFDVNGSTINNGIIDDTLPCIIGTNEIEIGDLVITETLTIDNGEIATITGTVTVQGTLVNNGEIKNRGHIILDGGLLQNIGTITNFCFNFNDRGITVSSNGGVISPPGTINDVICFAPVAVDDDTTTVSAPSVLTTDEDTLLDIDTAELLSNDSDADGDSLSVTAVDATSANGGTVSLVGTTITYTPASNFNGDDTFGYTISDEDGATDTATVTVTVTSVNDPPVAVDDDTTTVSTPSVLTTDEDTLLDIDTVEILSNDSDVDGITLSVTAVDATSANGGTVSLVGTTITYTPASNFNGDDTFGYTVSDGNSGIDTAIVTIEVAPVNDSPVAVDDDTTTASTPSVLTTDEDTSLDIDTVEILSNDSDVDGDTLSVTATSSSGGTVSLVGTTITYTPASNFNGDDTFGYTVSDGNGGTDTATVTITVNPIDDGPIATGPSRSGVTSIVTSAVSVRPLLSSTSYTNVSVPMKFSSGV